MRHRCSHAGRTHPADRRSPSDIYDEPANAFVADFIGESNILRGTMMKDELVSFAGHSFPCVDYGFGENVPVDVVVRPEDIMLVGEDVGQLVGTVKSVLFKGVHFETIDGLRRVCLQWLHSRPPTVSRRAPGRG